MCSSAFLLGQACICRFSLVTFFLAKSSQHYQSKILSKIITLFTILKLYVNIYIHFYSFYLGEIKKNMVTSLFMGIMEVDIIKYDE